MYPYVSMEFRGSETEQVVSELNLVLLRHRVPQGMRAAMYGRALQAQLLQNACIAILEDLQKAGLHAQDEHEVTCRWMIT